MPMLSEPKAKLMIKLLALALAGVLSFFFAAPMISQTAFIRDSMRSLDESSDTVMKLSAATLSASLAITALPDDFATPLAETLADMNVYFIAILTILFFEELMLQYGLKAAFFILIPVACGLWALSLAQKKIQLQGLASRLCILALAMAFVVPTSTFLTGYVAADLNAYVEQTIADTEGGADKLNEAMEGGADDKTIFEKLSDLFHTAISGITDLMQHFQNIIRQCTNAIAILILTNCLMPLFTLYVFKWILRETFQLMLPMPPLRRPRKTPEAPKAPPALTSTGE